MITMFLYLLAQDHPMLAFWLGAIAFYIIIAFICAIVRTRPR